MYLLNMLSIKTCVSNKNIVKSGLKICTRLKNRIKNNSTWEGTFYQSDWVKIDSCSVILVFHFMCVAANASELFCMAHLSNINNAFYTILNFHSKYQILYKGKLTVKNQFKCEKVYFRTEMSEIYSRCVIFNL